MGLGNRIVSLASTFVYGHGRPMGSARGTSLSYGPVD
jgi:hypothetical protein